MIISMKFNLGGGAVMDLLRNGDTYGMWKIISFSGEKINKTKNTYLCECQCHYKTRKIMRKDIILSGKSKSCKYCSGFKDLVGQEYGKLTVKELDIKTTVEKNKTYWFCNCECGNITSVRYDTLQDMTTSSCGCSRDEYEDLTGNKYGLLTIIRYSHKKRYDYGTSSHRWVCMCDCGNETIVAQSDLVTGHTISCGCRTRSKGELVIKNFLDKFNFEYKEQFRFDNCKYKNPLVFDFLIRNYKTGIYDLAIEFDGIQHYQPIVFRGTSYTDVKEIYNVNVLRDEIKTDYCCKNNIKLLRIPYWELDDNNIEYILWDFLEKHNLIINNKIS